MLLMMKWVARGGGSTFAWVGTMAGNGHLANDYDGTDKSDDFLQEVGFNIPGEVKELQ